MQLRLVMPLVFTMLCALAIPAPAQLPLSVGVVGGPTFSSDAEKTGYHIGAVLGIDAPLLPVGLRFDGVMNQFSVAGGAKLRIFDVTANVTYAMIPTPLVKPYLIGGIGFYGSRISGSADLGQNDIGVNGGAGVKLSLIMLKGFVDARYHHVFGTDGGMSFIPVSIGIMF